MKRSVAPLLLLSLTLSSAFASAQVEDEDALIRRGVQQRQEGHDDVALGLFRQAYERSHSARARAQMGLAAQSLGRWLEAEAHMREALAAATDPWIARNRVVLDGAFAVIQQHVGAIEVRGGVAGAAVTVNGVAAGTLPLAAPLRAVVGDATLEVRAPGYRPLRRTVPVPAGGLARETIDMLAIADEPAPTPVTATVAATAVVLVAPLRAQDDRGASSRATLRTLAWLSGGGAGLSLLTGVALQIGREGSAARYNAGADAGLCAGSLSPLESETDAGCRSDRSSAGTLRTLSVVGYTVGGALAVTSAVLFLVSAPRRRANTQARFGCAQGPGDFGLACGGAL